MNPSGIQVPPGWKYIGDAVNEWRPPELSHPAYAFMLRQFREPGTVFDWDKIPPEVNNVQVPVLYVHDAEGMHPAVLNVEPRFIREGTDGSPLNPFAMDLTRWVLHQPREAMRLFNAGAYASAMVEARKGESKLHRNIYLRARACLETEKAFSAFEELFAHYSRNEELWRLERLMEEFLSFDLEEHPAMQKYRDLLTSQVKHLRDGGRITARATHQWYAEGSPPAEGFDETIAKESPPTPRHQWLVETCRANGYKKVAEWGSVNGVSLYSLIRAAPDVAWYGFEANPKCREVGIETARKAGFKVNGDVQVHDGAPTGLRYYPGPGVFTLLPFTELYKYKEFDAVALFEVLEHNDPASGEEIVHECLSSLRRGGTLFITTPCGNWSGFDEKTRDLSLRKDHINAYTPLRMVRFLQNAVKNYGGGGTFELKECFRAENSELTENNAWVVTSVKRLS